MDIDAVAEVLYSLPPDEFTTARNAQEAEAKAAGDKQLAAEIHQIRKPSTGAWLANQLVREHPEEVQQFLDLGAAMREATAMLSGDQLRELGKQRRQLVAGLIQRVRGLAAAAERNVSQDIARSLEDTLHAALADDGVAERLKAGRLTDLLQGEGFPMAAGPAPGSPSSDPTPPGPPSPGSIAPGPPSTGTTSLGSRAADPAEEEPSERPGPDHSGRADRDERLARDAVQDTVVQQVRAQAAVDLAETAVRTAAALVTRLRAELDEAEVERSRREQAHRKAQADLAAADQAAKEAAQRLDEAVKRRER